MSIDANLREFLLDPALRCELSVPLDQCVLHSKEGDVELDAQLRSAPDGKGFVLELRDRLGRDLDSFFERKDHYSSGDGIMASGWLDGRFPIEIANLFYPRESSLTLVGIEKSSRGKFYPGKIQIPPNSTDHYPNEDTAGTSGEGALSYTHYAIFRNAGLRMVNTSIKEERRHPLFGKTSVSSEEAWVGSVFGGKCCLSQAGKDLEIHFEHSAKSDEEALLYFWCLLDAVAFVHAILPWPTFRQHRRDGLLLERELAMPGDMSQGRFLVIRKADTYKNASAEQLLDKLARLSFGLSSERRQSLRRLLWVFRGADVVGNPFPAQLIGVCTVIEGLWEFLIDSNISPPDDFLDIKNKAMEWARSQDGQNPHSKRLLEYLRGWRYQNRRTFWHLAFDPLFPNQGPWLDGVFKVFGNYRNDLAHGDFNRILTDNSRSDIEALNTLAGFVNLVVAAFAGVEGELLEKPFGREKILLKSSQML